MKQLLNQLVKENDKLKRENNANKQALTRLRKDWKLQSKQLEKERQKVKEYKELLSSLCEKH
jgi:regulator of replication initiation timing